MGTLKPNGVELQLILDTLKYGCSILLTSTEKEANYARVRIHRIIKQRCGKSVLGFAVRGEKLYSWSFIKYAASRLSDALRATIEQSVTPIEHFGYGQEVPTYETLEELQRQLQEPFATLTGNTDDDFVRAAEELIKKVEGRR